MTHRIMAWLGTALKSSQPSRSAVRRSDRRMRLMIGPDAISGAVWPTGVTLLGYDVAMSLSPLRQRAALAQARRRRAAITIGPDAKTRIPNRPSRELKR